MQIRPLTEAEMTSASQLVRQVLGEHVEATYPEEAKSAFYAFIEPENLNRMRAENEAILIGCGDEMGLHACGPEDISDFWRWNRDFSGRGLANNCCMYSVRHVLNSIP